MRRLKHAALAFLMGSGFGLPVLAQSANSPATPASPSCQGEAFAQFDFWLGTWDVHDLTGKKVGENVIEKKQGGCLLTETWQSTGGSTGESYNFYDPVSEKWRQVWVSPGSIIDLSGGLTDTGSMKLEGTITYTGNGMRFPFKGEWTPKDDGTVTQNFQQYDPEADEWKGWFTGIYSRKSIKL